MDKASPKHNSSFYHLYRMALVAILTAIAEVLMLLEFPVWFVPPFYKIDFSEFPIIIGALALGPVEGVVMELLKNLINLLINGTDTAFVGEFANFLMGVSFVLPAALIYARKKTKKRAVIGLVCSTVAAVVVGSLLNAYILLPMYCKGGFTMEAIIEMGTKANSAVKSLQTFILFGVAPFNLLKYTIVSVLTLISYKRISRILKNPLERA